MRSNSAEQVISLVRTREEKHPRFVSTIPLAPITGGESVCVCVCVFKYMYSLCMLGGVTEKLGGCDTTPPSRASLPRHLSVLLLLLPRDPGYTEFKYETYPSGDAAPHRCV